jgi:hypothetical protein
MTEHTTSHVISKIFYGFLMALAAALVGYFLVYWWVFRDFNDVLNVSSLRNQVISTQQASSVKGQLKNLGYQFSDSDFYQLNSPTSTSYRANVLQGYEPEIIEDEPAQEEGYYFYDESGAAYFFYVDETGIVDPETLIPLISE